MTHKWNQNIAASNKDRIEKLEAELQEVCDGIQHMECEKMQNTEDSLNEIKNLLSRVNQFSEKSTNLSRVIQFSEKSTNNTKEKLSTSHGSPTGDKSKQATLPLKHIKMDFPRFSRDNPTEWLNRLLNSLSTKGQLQSRKWRYHDSS
jgi:Mg2+ and Co2+ transporter CorA